MKGLDLIKRVKYEIKHNVEVHNQSVKIPVRNLELLIELAESNQYRLDLDISRDLMKYASALKKITNMSTLKNDLVDAQTTALIALKSKNN